MKRIYLDYNASTPLDPRVLKVLIKEFEEEAGNPSSTHSYGREAKTRLDKSRAVIADYFKVKPNEIIFTSGGTEGATLLLQGVMQRAPLGHVLTSNVEHSAVFENLKAIEKKGASISFLPAQTWGAVQPEAVRQALRPETRLMTLMAVNNETGVMAAVDAIAAIAEEAHVPLIMDGVAWLGKEEVKIPAGVSAVFFSGHKIYAPKGVGFCVCRQSLKLAPYFFGGAQEYNKRAGTENLPGIIALAKAIEILQQEERLAIARMRALRDRLEEGILSQIVDVVVNGTGPRASNVTNLSFLGLDGEALLIALDMEGIAVSHGSACASGALEPSRILLEMGIPLKQARSAIRFSVGRTTTEEEIDQVICCLVKLINRFRT